jgi:hypothetical protein
VSARYAANTATSSSASRAEIEHDLERFGATAFQYGWDSLRKRAEITFTINGRHVRMSMALPPKDHPDVRLTPNRKLTRTPAAQEEAYEQLVRQRWRVLALGIKAKLALVEAGITTLEEEFLANVLLPGGETVGSWVAPVVTRAYELGAAPAAFPLAIEGEDG